MREPIKKSRDELLKEIYEKYPERFRDQDFESFKQSFCKVDSEFLETIAESAWNPFFTIGSGSPSSSSSSPLEMGDRSYLRGGPSYGGASSPVGSGNPSSGSSCFVATAAFGSSLENDVVVLAQFRDRYLLDHRAGQAFVKLYYRFSPMPASFIRKHDSIRFVVRMALYPLVKWSKRLLN